MNDGELLNICNKYLSYNKNTGVFKWIKKSKKSTRIGSIAGHKNSLGYIQIRLKKKMHLAHRLSFLLENGYLPKAIDHINGNPTDTRISNLREATQYQNTLNRGISKNNISGYKGVHFDKSRNKWMAYINFNKLRINLGRFSCKHTAARAYNLAARMYHGKFAYTNNIIPINL